MTSRNTSAIIAASLLAASALQAQRLSADWTELQRPTTHAPAPTSAAITAADLRTRLFLISDDSMLGRLTGTAGNAKTVDYVAAEFKRFGLEPAGDNGTFFQNVPVVQRTVDTMATLGVGGSTFRAFTDFVPRDQGPSARGISGVPTVYGGVWGTATQIAPTDVAGKVVILGVRADDNSSGTAGVPSRPQIVGTYRDAAGIAVVVADRLTDEDKAGFKEPSGAFLPELLGSRPLPAYVYINPAMARAALGTDMQSATVGQAGQPFTGELQFPSEPLDAPVRNVVAILRGSDPKLRGEYVAIGAHNDHIGTGPAEAHDSLYAFTHLFQVEGADDPVPELGPGEQSRLNAAIAAIRAQPGEVHARPDSVFNGADDDGSGTVSLIEIAEYFARSGARPKRSLLFVSHVGEEEGLLGSYHFTEHPTVPRDSIVAQLNMDMIGRGDTTDVTGTTKDGREIFGGPGYVQLVGSRRLSTELGNLIEQVNTSGHHGLHFDYSLDANGHPANIYCRSDHYSYARWGIPITFFTTGLHADYHQRTDEPQYIDYEHMAKIANFVADVATHVANLDHRVVVDQPKPDPHGSCRQ